MNLKSYKKLIPFLSIAIILFIISMFNLFVSKGRAAENDDRYNNQLNDKVLSADYNNVDYDYIKEDLNTIEAMLNEILNRDVDISKKTEYYRKAQDVYDNKLTEIVAVLNQKLDDEDFENLQSDIDEFYKNIDYATDEMKTTIKSSIDVNFNIYKYMYEEKQRKCNDVLENYKGFLNIK